MDCTRQICMHTVTSKSDAAAKRLQASAGWGHFAHCSTLPFPRPSRAVQLRPHDARMWNAMGHCYQQEQLGLLDAAIRCHRRALPFDKEGVAVHELVRSQGGAWLAGCSVRQPWVLVVHGAGGCARRQPAAGAPPHVRPAPCPPAPSAGQTARAAGAAGRGGALPQVGSCPPMLSYLVLRNQMQRPSQARYHQRD